jgi:hypothetical protein
LPDKKGQLSYSWEVPENFEKGIYAARFSGAVEGDRSSSASINFEVSTNSSAKNFEVSKGRGGSPFMLSL